MSDEFQEEFQIDHFQEDEEGQANTPGIIYLTFWAHYSW